jgi:integrase
MPAIKAEKTTFEDLVRLHLDDLSINGRNPERAEVYVSHLRETFGRLRACEITTTPINEYIVRRKEGGAANGSINRELRGLKRMFRLASEHTPPLVLFTPKIPHLREDNVRKGFFTFEEYQKLREALPEHLTVPLVLGYWTGMRAGEILGLRWDQVNVEEGWIRLESGATKNGHGRTVPLVPEARAALIEWRKKMPQKYADCEWVCHYLGKRMKKVPKKMWRTTCDRLEMPGKLFHDLRRTAVRNMVRAGISERIAMEISGHRTRSVFDRYDIVDEADLLGAAVRLQAVDRRGPR